MSDRQIIERAQEIIRRHGGTVRTRDALALGIHPRTLYALRDSGLLETLGRGLYRLVTLPPLENPDLVTVAHRVPRGVICLTSALAFHELTTQIPHAVDVALCYGDERPRVDYPPLHVYWFSRAAWEIGVESHQMDGTTVRVYSPAKSIADSFKFRRRLGLDLAIEALRTFRQRSEFDATELLSMARVCRVENIIRPYLETLL